MSRWRVPLLMGLTFLVTVLAAFIILVSLDYKLVHSSHFFDPVLSQDRYTAAGDAIHADYMERDPDYRLHDGSHWLDGVSHELPELPLDKEERMEDHMTCAQVGALNWAVFPHDRASLDVWKFRPDSDRIARLWESRIIEAVWSDNRAYNPVDWCGPEY